jgi:hypothetical protein
MADLTFKQGETKTIELRVKNADGAPADLSAATLFFGVKKNKSDTVYAFSKEDAVFGKSQAAQGIITFGLLAADSNLAPGPYVGELQCSWDGTIDKSADLIVQVKQAVIPPAP